MTHFRFLAALGMTLCVSVAPVRAQEIGLDLGKFKKALDSGKFNDKIEADQKLASSVGANGTPTFFVNGVRYTGEKDYDSLRAD